MAPSVIIYTVALGTLAASDITISGGESGDKVCANTRYTFTASPAGMQAYQWAVKGMGTIVSGQGTSSITVSTNENPAGCISVAVDNGCGYGHESNKTLMPCNAISVQTYPVPSEDYLNLRISSFYEEQNIEQSAEEVRESDEYEIRLYNDHSLLIRQMKTKS